MTGDALSQAAVELLTQHGFELVEGGAAGLVTQVGDELVLTLPVDGPKRRASGLSVASVAGIAALGAAAIPVAGFAAAPAAAAAVAAAAAAEQRRRLGRRTGPRPTKPRRATVEAIAQMQAEGKSLHAIAAELQALGIRAPGGGRWYATTVKRAQDAMLAETTVVLRRLGSLLDDLDDRELSEKQLAELGAHYRFHHHRLLRAFELGVGAPYVGRYVPVVERRGELFATSAKGSELMQLWRRSEELDDAVEAALLDVSRAGDRVPFQVLEAIVQQHGVGIDELAPRLVRKARNTWRLTEEGQEIAATWRRIADPDPRERLDIDFWPSPDEEDLLAPTWDWEDDPLIVRQAK